jgi:hypothetical protein
MSNPLGSLYSFEFIVCIVCAIGWYNPADVEDVAPCLWVGLSVAVYAFTWLWLGRAWAGNLVGQGALLLLAVTLFRAWRSHRAGGG